MRSRIQKPQPQSLRRRQGDIETNTINGGMNGSDDRVARFALALVALGPEADSHRRASRVKGLIADGDFGPRRVRHCPAELLPLSGASAAGSSPPIVPDKLVVPGAMETRAKRKFDLPDPFGRRACGDGPDHLRLVLAPASMAVLPWRERPLDSAAERRLNVRYEDPTADLFLERRPGDSKARRASSRLLVLLIEQAKGSQGRRGVADSSGNRPSAARKNEAAVQGR
ncbi:hypothetical protein [Rhizobium favelukesii]|uniref:hypothetical protein n=1 Tax=Rhizobium favelukesii TaxID=348824 RepID=UPI00040AB5E0|nr:hypothetical protein [Rhizobium favelukesii]MCS0457911.1 hypothetical protein [Rhizobium favelukesii]